MPDLLLFLYALIMGVLVGELVGFYQAVIIFWIERSWREQCAHDCLHEREKLAPRWSGVVDYANHLLVACSGCGRIVQGYRRLALLNWLLHSGRCAGCGGRPENFQLWPQLIVTVLTVFVVMRQGLEPRMPLLLLQLWGWSAIAFISLRHQLIPDLLVFPLLWLSLLAAALGLSIPVEEAVTGAVVGYLVPLAIYHACRLILKREILGYGVFKAGAAIGAMLGGTWVLSALGLAFAFKAGENMVRQGKVISENGLLPVGHWLALVAIISHLWLGL